MLWQYVFLITKQIFVTQHDRNYEFVEENFYAIQKQDIGQGRRQFI